MDGISLQNTPTFTPHSLKLWTSEFANVYTKRCPWKLVTIVSKLVYNFHKRFAGLAAQPVVLVLVPWISQYFVFSGGGGMASSVISLDIQTHRLFETLKILMAQVKKTLYMFISNNMCMYIYIYINNLSASYSS